MKISSRHSAMAVATVPLFINSSLRAAVVQADMSGVVQSAFFGAESFLPVGTRLDFHATYETDPALNPDQDPSAVVGRYALASLSVSGLGEAGPSISNHVGVQDGDPDTVNFTLGFGQLPGAGGFSFNSANLGLRDLSGTALHSDDLPLSVMTFSTGSFLLRWGGADGPAVSGSLNPVPEPTSGLLLVGTAVVLWGRSRRSRRSHASTERG